MHAPGAIPAADRVGIALRGLDDRSKGRTSAVVQALVYSSGRMLALCRAVLAGLFLVALAADPSQPVRIPALANNLLLLYLLIAVVLLGIAWWNWWVDFRLAPLALVLDVTAFLAAVAVTEGQWSYFTSPFMAFFAYLMLTAAVRFGSRATLGTALVVTLAYLALGVWMAGAYLQFDSFRYGRRLSYMVVLALVMAWFAVRRREQHVDRFVEPLAAESGGELPLQAALRYAAGQTFARDGVIACADFEEPRTRVLALGQMTVPSNLPPERFDPEREFGTFVRWFERKHGHCLRAKGDGRVESCSLIPERLAEETGVREALAIPVAGPSGRGEILLTGIPGVCSDHVQLAVPLAREISASFDRQAGLALATERALVRMRDSLARDLHDSVAQSLAGAALRLEGLSASIRRGEDPQEELEAVKHSLRVEQRHVRSLISRLRDGSRTNNTTEAAAALRSVVQPLEAYWGATLRLAAPDNPVPIPTGMAHEMALIVREAVANAVRHGRASEVALGLLCGEGHLQLTISDDGAGFPSHVVRPWTIDARVQALGGSLIVRPVERGTCLEIELPLQIRQ